MTKTARLQASRLDVEKAHDEVRAQFERALALLQGLAAAKGKAERLNWGHVGSLQYANGLLREALAHYGINE